MSNDKDRMIPVSKDGGLEPHVLKCTECGESYGLSVGELYVATYTADGEQHSVYADRDAKSKVYRKAKERGIQLSTFKHIPVEQKDIVMGVCNTCDEKKAKEGYDNAINECVFGAVLFRCLECGTGGYIPYTDETKEFCDDVRWQNEVEFGEVCGVEFDTCEKHGGSTST
jgi:hypothetical protein